jgi:hypothetical protein
MTGAGFGLCANSDFPASAIVSMLTAGCPSFGVRVSEWRGLSCSTLPQLGQK